MLFQKHIFSRWFIVLIVVLIQACTQIDKRELSTSTKQNASAQRVKLGRVVEQPLKLIANDLIDAFSQIPTFSQKTTVIRVPIARTKFDEAVESELQSKGYPVEQVNLRSGTNVMVSTMLSGSGDGRVHQTHTLVMGNVALKRTYSVENNKVTPTSSLFVRGADKRAIRLDDRKFLSNRYKHPANLNSLYLDGLYLCTPEGKGPGTDGWICREGKTGKQWINAAAHDDFIKQETRVQSVDWDVLMTMPDRVILKPDDIPYQSSSTGNGQKPDSLYLCTPNGKGAGTDGWVCRTDQNGKQWIDSETRASLVVAGTQDRWIDWALLMAMSDKELVSPPSKHQLATR